MILAGVGNNNHILNKNVLKLHSFYLIVNTPINQSISQSLISFNFFAPSLLSLAIFLFWVFFSDNVFFKPFIFLV